jgi:hypothetical protein
MAILGWNIWNMLSKIPFLIISSDGEFLDGTGIYICIKISP